MTQPITNHAKHRIKTAEALADQGIDDGLRLSRTLGFNLAINGWITSAT
jgi:hypothetical protein